MKLQILLLSMTLPAVVATPAAVTKNGVLSPSVSAALKIGDSSGIETAYGRGYRPYYPYPQRRYRRCY